MYKRIISVILAMMIAVMVSAAFAQGVSMDPFEEITDEFSQAVTVEPYQVVVRPARVTGWAVLRWAPSRSALLLATYSANQELTVRKETPNWLLVENKTTGDIGYILRQDVTEPSNTQQVHELVTTIADNGKTDLGIIDINGAFSLQCALAEGYSIQLIRSTNDQMIAMVSSEDPLKPVLQLSVGYDEAYAYVDRLNDLDDEALNVLEKTFIDTDPTVEISYGDTGLGTRLIIVRMNETGTEYLDFMSIYKGYFVECVMVPSAQAPDKTLTEEQIQMCIDFLTEMDFVPTVEAGNAQAPREATYVTNLTDYDPETNTVQAEVMHTITVPQEEAEALKAGDTLTVGMFSEVIETIENDGEGDIYINYDIRLTKYGDEYHLYIYELEYLERLVKLTMKIPDNLLIYDNIDKVTGEPLDESVQYSVEEFKAMLASGEYPNFATENVLVTFDENGEMTAVVRDYSPAQ